MATGFSNSFTEGEISDDAWDRTDIQPVGKGCERAINYVPRVVGPLGKRRGFWDLGNAFDSASHSKLIPFRRSIDDALMLEFSNVTVRVWNNDGAPYPDGMGGQVTFASPYSEADLDGLRYKQVNDVIQFRNRTGLLPLSLERFNNTTWAFAPTTYPDGPWRPENLDKTFTVTVTGADEADQNVDNGGAGAILVGTVVNLVASADLFDPLHVGASFRFRQTDGQPSVMGWKPGYRPTADGTYATSVGRAYKMTARGNHDETITNPPTQTDGFQSDGGNTWEYRHDGAGIVVIDTVVDTLNATGHVTKALPFRSTTATYYWAEAAYSTFRGWPRMWPALREERFVEGATASNLDFVDLTETAGFTPFTETFTPGLGSGQVIATDAVRRRAGEDGAELIWAASTSYLLLGSASGEFLLAGGVLDEGISPTSVTLKQLSEYGSEDVYPAKAHKALIHVARGAQTLRELTVDTQQNGDSQDLTVLASHIAERGFAQLAWVPQPDENLWLRLNEDDPDLADGGIGAPGLMAALTYHKEQAVRGFCRVALPGGWICENLAVLPGPGRLETLWGIFSRVKDGATQRRLWMMSRKTDQLFMDCAAFYEGIPVTSIAGLDHLAGETVRVLVDGQQLPDLVVGVGGVLLLPDAFSKVYVGLSYACRFKSLKLDTRLGGSLNARQRVVSCTVSLKTALAKVGLEVNGVAQLTETVSPRTAADVPLAVTRRVIKNVTLAGDADYDPRIVITDDTSFDGVIYSLKPKVATDG